MARRAGSEREREVEAVVGGQVVTAGARTGGTRGELEPRETWTMQGKPAGNRDRCGDRRQVQGFREAGSVIQGREDRHNGEENSCTLSTRVGERDGGTVTTG